MSKIYRKKQNTEGWVRPGAPMPGIRDVIFNPPATIVLWDDGTKSVVKAHGADEYDPEKGLSMAIAKRALGNSGEYYEKMKQYLSKFTQHRPVVVTKIYCDGELIAEYWEEEASGDE